LVKPSHWFAGVQSPPLRGGQASVGGLAGETPGRRERRFFGGMRSARPHGKGVLKPRHNMIIGGERTPGGLMRRSRGGSEASFAGMQSPPLQGDIPPI
jgi:hypothetical protein